MTLQLKIQEIFLDWRKKTKQSEIEQSKILNIFLSMEKHKIISSYYVEYESNRDRNKILTIEEYLNKLGHINNLKKSDTWNIQLTTTIYFISAKDNDGECVMHLKSDNTDFMIYDNADEVTEDIFETLLNRDEIGLETSIRVSDFIFDCVHLFYYKY